MNLVILIGRLTKDPRINHTESGYTIADFTLAVDRERKKEGQQTADFISCKAIGKVAETIEKFVFKGVKIAVRGRWETGSYEKKDGSTVYTNTCLLDSFEFVEPKGKKEEQWSDPEDSSLPFN